VLHFIQLVGPILSLLRKMSRWKRLVLMDVPSWRVLSTRTWRSMFMPCHISTNISFLKIGCDFMYLLYWTRSYFSSNPRGCQHQLSGSCLPRPLHIWKADTASRPCDGWISRKFPTSFAFPVARFLSEINPNHKLDWTVSNSWSLRISVRVLLLQITPSL
jgi:hypothetical protein